MRSEVSRNILIIAKKTLVRIVPQNDWVVFTLTACIIMYVFMLLYFHRDSSVRVFLLQKLEDSSNNLLSWIIISSVYTVLLATLLSPSVPVVPKMVTNLGMFGYELNKFGFTFLGLSVIYISKSILSYLFFAGTGSLSKWPGFIFLASKFYFVVSILLMGACFYQYFYEVHFSQLFNFYFAGFVIAFFFKILLFLISPTGILPQRWYYKILYICTLQITPVLVLWRVLYF